MYFTAFTNRIYKKDEMWDAAQENIAQFVVFESGYTVYCDSGDFSFRIPLLIFPIGHDDYDVVQPTLGLKSSLYDPSVFTVILGKSPSMWFKSTSCHCWIQV
jgi:hypothetical protein